MTGREGPYCTQSRIYYSLNSQIMLSRDGVTIYGLMTGFIKILKLIITSKHYVLTVLYPSQNTTGLLSLLQSSLAVAW
jgi:hypothetical protein